MRAAFLRANWVAPEALARFLGELKWVEIESPPPLWHVVQAKFSSPTGAEATLIPRVGQRAQGVSIGHEQLEPQLLEEGRIEPFSFELAPAQKGGIPGGDLPAHGLLGHGGARPRPRRSSVGSFRGGSGAAFGHTPPEAELARMGTGR